MGGGLGVGEVSILGSNSQLDPTRRDKIKIKQAIKYFTLCMAYFYFSTQTQFEQRYGGWDYTQPPYLTVYPVGTSGKWTSASFTFSSGYS